MAALEALTQAGDAQADECKKFWVKRPGGVIIALTREQAQSAVRQGMCIGKCNTGKHFMQTFSAWSTDMSESKERLQLLQKRQRELTEALSERGDPGQALLNAIA